MARVIPVIKSFWGLNRDETSLTVTVSQLQNGDAFLDPLPIERTVNGEKIKRTIYPKSKLAVLKINLNGKLTSTKFDPDETLLKEVANEQ